jgi:hypothetical protein
VGVLLFPNWKDWETKRLVKSDLAILIWALAGDANGGTPRQATADGWVTLMQHPPANPGLPFANPVDFGQQLPYHEEELMQERSS